MKFDGINLAKADFHTHTIYCDGKNTPREMVESAIAKGLECIGILVHCHLECEKTWCRSESLYPRFISEVNSLKREYGSRIKVLCGIEQDYHSQCGTEGFDYIIGAVHLVNVAGRLYCVDDSENDFVRLANDVFGGDYYSLCECYYETLSGVVKKTGCDIIAHFDLITKFIEKLKCFDTRNERYKRAWKDCVDALVPYGKRFELNTGAISRGFRTSRYPAGEICSYMQSKGAKFVNSSDAHSVETVGFLC